MSRISDAFNGKKAFIGFITAGDPSLEKTEEYILEMERAGATLIELGIPFSDPVAEGSVIQEANIRALAAGCTTDKIFDMVRSLRKKTQIPLVFMAYANTLYRYGYERFCALCKEVGVDGLIIPDMPFEEKCELSDIAEGYDIDVISFIVPTTEKRMKMIAGEAKGFIYMLPSMSETKKLEELKTDTKQMIKVIKEATDLPIAVNLETGNMGETAEYTKMSDGAIAGTAIVKLIEKHGEYAAEAIYEYVSEKVEELTAV